MQAVLNLLDNAADAALDGEDWVRLSGMITVGRLTLLVRDGGLGVPAGQEDATFRPFFTLKPGGIGLALARQIARSQGGSLVLDPPVAGQGAEF
jgi:signal transduction histidine kinase